VKRQLIKELLRAHVERDDPAFRKAALQLVSAESAAGHTKAAEELRELLTRSHSHVQQGRTGLIVDIAQPRGDLAELLEGSHRSERFKDIVLEDETAGVLERIVQENRQRASLQGWGVQPRRKLLFFGPAGCGKTLAASVLAGELGMPLMTVRFDALFSRFLGATANHLRLIFQEMPKRPGVYFFDEFDAVAKKRGDLQDVGEMRRIVTSFLQLIDADRSASLLIAATNHVDLLDHAVFRRFDASIAFNKPNEQQLVSVLRLKLARFRIDNRVVKRIAKRHEGISYADATRSCEDAIRSMALEGRTHLAESDLIDSFARIASGNERELIVRK
jgi:SpoVK/Ycf46/Vps4 family AAA+-type ATPase